MQDMHSENCPGKTPRRSQSCSGLIPAKAPTFPVNQAKVYTQIPMPQSEIQVHFFLFFASTPVAESRASRAVPSAQAWFSSAASLASDAPTPAP